MEKLRRGKFFANLKEQFRRKPSPNEMALNQAKLQDQQRLHELKDADLAFGGEYGDDVTIDSIRTHFAVREAHGESSYLFMIAMIKFNGEQTGTATNQIVEELEQAWPLDDQINCIVAQRLDSLEGIEKAKEFFNYNIDQGLRGKSGYTIEELRVSSAEWTKGEIQEIKRTKKAYETALRVLDERKTQMFPEV